MEKNKLLIKESLKKLKKAYYLLELMKKINYNLIDKIYPLFEQPIPPITPNIQPPSMINSSVQQIQIESIKSNIDDLVDNFNGKLEKIEKLFNRILINKSKIRSIRNLITKQEKNQNIDNVSINRDLNLSLNLTDALSSDMDNLEIELNNIFNSLKSFSAAINNLNTVGKADPASVNPNQLLNLKNNISYFGKMIKEFEKKLKNKEEEITSLENNVNNYINPSK